MNSNAYKTLDLRPDTGEMIKPSETIDVVFGEGLSLNDRRCWNALISNAFGPDMRDEERDFRIDLSKLRSNHNSNERVEDTVEKLMRTIARCKMPDGSITRFQLLGGNNMGDPTRPRGELTYSFDKRLIEAVKDSISFGKLEIAVMAAFSSKYALALYEHVARRINLRNRFSEDYTVEQLREILDVQPHQGLRKLQTTRPNTRFGRGEPLGTFQRVIGLQENRTASNACLAALVLEGQRGSQGNVRRA